MAVREEAFPFAAPLAVAGAAAAVAGFFGPAVTLGLASAAVCAFFRDPERTPPEDPLLLLSPADGRLLPLHREGGTVRLSVFMSVFNVHVNRVPYPGVVREVRYNPGRFLAAWSDKASLDNEQVRILLDTDRGPLTVVQIAGLIARRVVCWAVPGRVFDRAERLGLIRFGSRVDLYLPQEAVEILAAPGDRVRAGATPVARWRVR